MAGCIVINGGGEAVSLPYPLQGELGAGQSVMVPFTQVQLLASIPLKGATGTLKFIDQPGVTSGFDVGFATAQVLDPGAIANWVRGVVLANIASLAAFTVAGNDGLTYVAGDRVLLVGQSTASQNGPYVVGPVVAGVAPLVRPLDWQTGVSVLAGSFFQVQEGAGGKNGVWQVVTTGAIVVDTTNVTIQMEQGNWVSAEHITTLGTQAAGAGIFVIGALLKAKISGLFRLDLHIAFSDGTTADPVTVTLVSDTSAAGALASANAVAHGIKGFGGADGDLKTIDTNAGAKLTYNGADFATAPQTHKVDINPTLTGLLTAQATGGLKFDFSGIIQNAAPAGTVKTPFPIGNTVAVGVKFACPAGTLTIASVSLTFTELPNL